MLLPSVKKETIKGCMSFTSYKVYRRVYLTGNFLGKIKSKHVTKQTFDGIKGARVLRLYNNIQFSFVKDICLIQR